MVQHHDQEEKEEDQGERRQDPEDLISGESTDHGPVGIVAAGNVFLGDLGPGGSLQADPGVVELLDEGLAPALLFFEDGPEVFEFPEGVRVRAEDLELPAFGQVLRSIARHLFFLLLLELALGSGGSGGCGGSCGENHDQPSSRGSLQFPSIPFPMHSTIPADY
jgi:hypothetical protein